MVSLLKYWIRYIITLCFIVVVAFMVACTLAVIYFAVRGDIRIHMVKDNKKKK